MVLLVFAVASTAVLVGVATFRIANRGCRLRCTCVDDSQRLDALASVAEHVRAR